MSQGDRLNGGKTKWSLLHLPTIEGMVKVLEFGAKKYASFNWAKGLPYTEIIDSMDRHKMAFLMGEDYDQESGLPHVDHIQCNSMFLAFMFRYRPDMDDRVIFPEVLEAFKKSLVEDPNQLKLKLD